MNHAITRSRPTSLSPEVQRKLALAKAHLAKRDRIARIREALQNIIDQMEADWARQKRASCAGYAEPSLILLAAYDIDAAFDELCSEDLK